MGPLAMFPGYGAAGLLTFGIHLVTSIYAGLRYLEDGCCGKYPWDMFPLYIFNKTVCWTSLWLFGFVYFLGGLAHIMPKPLPMFLVNLLSIRKHLGNLGFFYIVVHVLISLLIFGPNYYGKFYDKERMMLTGKAELSMLLGVLGFGVMVLVAMASVPSIGSRLSWREWSFIQRWLGLIATTLGAAHVVVMGYQGWSHPVKGLGKYTGHKGMPSITFVSTLPIMVIVAFRIIVAILPPSLKPKSRILQTPSWFHPPADVFVDDLFEPQMPVLLGKPDEKMLSVAVTCLAEQQQAHTNAEVQSAGDNTSGI